MNNNHEPTSGGGAGGGESFGYRYRFADAEFDEVALTLRVGQQEATVEPLPLRVLAELLRRPNEAVTRAELLDRLWPEPTGDHVLTSAISKLRQALGSEAVSRIESVPRVGYRFAGSVERIAVGRRAVAPMELNAGQPVLGRPGSRLLRSLGGRIEGTVWLAGGAAPAESRVFKFANDGENLSILKREYTVSRLLRQGLGARADFVQLMGANFETPPYFLEYEYSGADMPRWASEGARLAGMPMAARIAVCRQIAEAVAAAHALGVLHGDLKPANVLVSDTAAGPQVRLADFGASRLLQPDRLHALGITALGLTVSEGADTAGTPLFLAPELIAGHPPTLASDVYALGLILYQLLVGDFHRPMSTGWQRCRAAERRPTMKTCSRCASAWHRPRWGCSAPPRRCNGSKPPKARPARCASRRAPTSPVARRVRAWTC